MLVELGHYEPFGKDFLEKRPHLGQESALNPVIDFSALDLGPSQKPFPAPRTIHKLFNVSDTVSIDAGDRLDERSLYQRGKLDNPAIQLEQEVYVKGSTVVWSRGGYVMKTFDYSAEDQPIQQVLFAWFPVTSTFFKSDPTNKPAVDTILNDLGGDRHLVEGYWEKKGPQSIINFNKSVTKDDNEEEEEEHHEHLKKPFGSLNVPDLEEKDHGLQRRTLCIVFQDYIKIHCEDGLNSTAHVPFEIGDVVPLDMGVLVSRKYVPGKLWKKGKERSASMTSLSSLAANNRYVPASTKSKVSFQYTHTRGAGLGPSAGTSGGGGGGGSEISSFFVTVTHPLRGACPVKSKDVNNAGVSTLLEPLTNPQKLLFATTTISAKGRLPVIVTLNIKDHKHYIWTYERRKEKNQPNIHQHSATAFFPPMTNTKRKGVHSLPKKRFSNKTVSNRNKKRKTNVIEPYAQFHEDYISDDEDVLHENELEKDIYHELLDPSEISLRLLWTENSNTKRLKMLKNIKSEAFLIHDLNGQELICIINYSLGSLQVVNLNKATQLLGNCIELKTAARSAIHINATRDNYNDLLYMDGSGSLQLFIDPSIPRMPLKLSIKNNATLTKLIDPVYDRFTGIFSNGDMVRYQFKLRPETSLVRDCFAAIDCAATGYFAQIWSRFLKLSYCDQTITNDCKRIQSKEWPIFVVALLSFLRLEKGKGGYYYSATNDNLKKMYLRHSTLVVHNVHNTLSNREVQLRQIRASNTNFITKELGFPSATGSYNYDFLLDENYMQGIPTVWMDQIVEFKSDIVMDLTIFSDIVNNLHVVYEDYRIKKTMAVHADLLGYLLMQCAIILGTQDWIDYYKNHGIEPKFAGNLQLVDRDMVVMPIEPPDIQICLRQMTPNTSSNPTLLSSLGVNTLEPSLGHGRHTYAKTIKNLWSLYGAINHISGDKSILLDRMILDRITRQDIEILIDSVAQPILDVLDNLKLCPLVDWTKEAYNVLGRDDIYKQLQMKVTFCDPNTDTFKLPFQKGSDHPQSMNDLMKAYSATRINKCIYESDVLNMETERLRFGFGGFIEKVRIMLDATRVPEHVVPEQPDLGDEDLATEHQAQVILLIQRTLSLAVGRGIYAFGTHVPDLTKVLPLEPITMTAKILPLRTVVTIDESTWNNEFLHWPQFHNGVAAGLRISPSNHVNDSWIDFCHPAELDPQHGGVLLAMGLNGVLKKLPLVHWYRFMTQTCDLVSVGFIMGAAVAYRGTKDIKVTKVLTVHIPALLPPESASFDHSNLIQATSLLGMGLVYMNSCDRLMGSTMLKEIGKNAYSDPSVLEPDYEGSALAAGFSLGFITLGVGEDALHLIDGQMRNKLYTLMTGRSAAALTDNNRGTSGKEEPTGSINLDVTSPGATVALGLMYLKTENSRVADGIELLETRPYLNYVRPDFLLIRVVAKNLIMWSNIQPTNQWIDDQLPDFITSSSKTTTTVNNTQTSLQQQTSNEHYHMHIDEEVSKQAMFNIICGACLCIGLRYAGSKNEDAFNCLLERLDYFIKLLNTQVTTPQQHITKSVVRTGVDVLCTAAAMVMAGTGNHRLLSRLEQLHQRITNDMTYGNHMAVSMSLGLLFMGLGGYTLTTTNEAVAGLLCAFYPFYPMVTDDNRYHLQAFRHLWVLAIDSRWLLPFDVANKKPCRVPMQLEIFEDDGGLTPQAQRKVRQVRIEAPTVVPDYKLIKSIRLDGDRYWPLSVDMLQNGKYQKSIIKSGVIYVKRKEKKQSYEDDPYGKRNLLTWT